ncbi:8710_t:CDS:2 [Acaulospora morrowiae]|uniref:8710_t:CDS:1 n=1 Tax=Acaulospora morrowiae TaxID=94023 RepID=A0A9N8YZD7_9GLOM|nr:8710_t:CDS:2 [Acaulospora morrowiae]
MPYSVCIAQSKILNYPQLSIIVGGGANLGLDQCSNPASRFVIVAEGLPYPDIACRMGSSRMIAFHIVSRRSLPKIFLLLSFEHLAVINAFGTPPPPNKVKMHNVIHSLVDHLCSPHEHTFSGPVNFTRSRDTRYLHDGHLTENKLSIIKEIVWWRNRFVDFSGRSSNVG